jgi:hypothetical protein
VIKAEVGEELVAMVEKSGDQARTRRVESG